MTQQELEAGADAVAKLASDAGYGSFINRDEERALAAAVIKAYEALHVNDKQPPKAS